ncbi:nucleotidyltransferase domain-containing protein [Aquibacillus kalidii]|uniref:nucleotidyltransferase domain-containing protein n=1 Tax=Aquibacillus kalidii TaxID=2762597 RepID=UPI001647CF0E|nr:nucleotidyltransferase domain-containing protein [Aquibacillus kalidii]
MIQEEALDQITASLKKDNLVKAIFVKGSMGRGEYDESSDIDLYCLVEKEDKEDFLTNRIDHLRSYREILFYDDIFIIAPQIIAIFDNMLHVDLFTVTEETLKEKDFIHVLHDPEHKLDRFIEKQNLFLSPDDFYSDAIDSVWFLFQYKKSAVRGNGLWSAAMLNQALTHFSKVLLHHYVPDRAQLGLKTLESSLPPNLLKEIKEISNNITPTTHKKAALLLQNILIQEKEWVLSMLKEDERNKLKPFYERMMKK